MKCKKKIWIRTFLMAFVCLNFSYVAASTPALTPLLDSLYSKISTNPGELPALMSDYCSSVLDTPAFVKDGFVYNAKYSTFIYLLCSNVSSASSSLLSSDYFKRSSFAQLGFEDIASDQGYQIDLCKKPMSNDCDLSKNVPKLFNGIINDYINFKQAGLYGLITDYKSESDLEIVVNDYSAVYFGVKLCSNTDHPYDATCRMVKSYVKSVRSILNEVTIFDAGVLLKLAPAKDDVPCSAKDPKLNIFYCGLKDDGTSMISFVNLLYNEVFYYRLFMGYYMIMIQKNPSLLANNSYVTDYSTLFKRFSSEYIWSKNALSLSLRMMRDTYMAFPFHVGFTMYQEDLDGFGKNLARIAPPIYTLYDKLRNVQKP